MRREPAVSFDPDLSKRAALFAALLLAALTLAAYLPALSAGFVWDDDDYVYKNYLLWEPDGLFRIWFTADAPSQYFPLVYTMFRIEYALWGLDPFGYHLVNVLLHVANALLLWRVLAELKIPGGVFAAALFALHPVHVESVAWITERKNVLSGLFFLLAVWSWVRYTDGAGRRPYALSLLCCQLGLFAKTTVCVLPAALVLTLWVRGRGVDRRHWLAIAPFVALGVVMGAVAILWEQIHQGTHAKLAPGWPDVLIVASRAVWFYLGKLALPLDLMFSYPKFAIDPRAPLQWLPLVALAGATLALYAARERIGRGPIAALVWYVAALSPILGFVSLYTFLYTYVADHYQYLASLGPIALAGAGVRHALARRGAPAVAVAAGLAAVLAACGALTYRYAQAYESRETLWADTAAKNPGSWMARHNLGEELLRQRRLEEAAAAFESALAIRADLDKTQRNLGVVRWRQGRLPEAREHLDAALRIRPDFWNGLATRGAFLVATGDPAAALLSYQRMTTLRPRRPEGFAGAGRALAALGRRADAESRFRAALALAPGNLPASVGLADVLATCPRSPAAAKEALERAEAARQVVGEADARVWAALAKARAAAGRAGEAREAADRAIRLAKEAADPALAASLEASPAFRRDGEPYCPTP
jgi:tetratricopeptide (TPR) repeat protein